RVPGDHPGQHRAAVAFRALPDVRAARADLPLRILERSPLARRDRPRPRGLAVADVPAAAAPRPLLADGDGDDGDVVALDRLAGVGGDVDEDRLDHVARLAVGAPHAAGEALLAVLLAGGVPGLVDPVGAEDDEVPGLELDRRLPDVEVVEDAQRGHPR